MEKYQYIALKDIQTNPYQPRKETTTTIKLTKSTKDLDSNN